MSDLLRIISVKPLDGFRVMVKLTDGSKRTLDLRPHLHGPIFKALLADPVKFQAVGVKHGTLSWPTGQDLDPDVLLGTSIAQRVAGRWIQATPQISDFDGISIYVYPNDHPPPHIHVYHGSDEAEVAILDGKVIQGKLKTLIVRKVREWLKLRRNEVFKSHAEAQTGKRPSKVPPP